MGEAEQGGADGANEPVMAALAAKADAVTNPAAERTDRGVSHDHRQQQEMKGTITR